jgi:hypothetical protein
VGYWFGLALAAVLGAPYVLALVRRGLGIGSLVAIGIGLTPLALLLPTIRRSGRPVARGQPPADPRPAPASGQSPALAWPRGWTRPLARGWAQFGLLLAVAVFFAPVGLAIVASGRGAGRWAGVSVTLFGLALADPRVVRMGRLQRALMGVNRRLGADLALPLRSLNADPVLLYTALRHYHTHPDARADLAAETGPDSLRRAGGTAPETTGPRA